MPAETVPSITRADVSGAKDPVMEVTLEKAEEGAAAGGATTSAAGGEKVPQLPFQSIFFMGMMDISKLVALSAWKGVVEDKSNPSSQSSPSNIPPSAPHLSSSSPSPSPSPSSAPSSPSSAPSPSPPTPPSNAKNNAMPPPPRNDEWNEACLGIWKNSSTKKEAMGKCLGISVVKASTQKELDELNKRPVSGLRVCILSEELEQERKQKELKAKAAKGLPAENSMSVSDAAKEAGKEFVERQVFFTKKLGEKLLSGEIFFKTANTALNSASRLAKDLRDWFSRRE